MLRCFALFICFLLFHLHLKAFVADDYFVIHLRGIVINKTTNKTLKVGDRLTETDKIQFKSTDAVAVVISSQKGRFTLSGSNKPVNSTFDSYIALVKNVLIPSKSRGMMSTRSLHTTSISNLDSILDTNQFFFPGEITKLRLSENKYPMNKQKYFVWQFTYNGKVVKSILPSDKDSLVIDRKKIYVVNGNYIAPESAGKAKLFYLENASARKIADFTPVFAEDDVLKAECEILLTALKDRHLQRPEMIEELYKYVEDEYGRTDFATFEKWVLTHITF